MFLLKPHVTGPTGQVTSPDVIVDRVFLDGLATPLHRLTHGVWQATVEPVAAAYAVMALGAGPLVLPVVVLSSGPIVVARQAWRLANFEAHAGEVTLNGVPLARIGTPSALIAQAAGLGKELPRGHLLVRTLPGASQTAELVDPRLGRTLAHAVMANVQDTDQRDSAQAQGRYAVGPTRKDVTHYI